jgi:hypothetical protein
MCAPMPTRACKFRAGSNGASVIRAIRHESKGMRVGTSVHGNLSNAAYHLASGPAAHGNRCLSNPNCSAWPLLVPRDDQSGEPAKSQASRRRESHDENRTACRASGERSHAFVSLGRRLSADSNRRIRRSRCAFESAGDGVQQ